MIRDAVKKAVEGKDLSREESRAVMEMIMSGGATDAQIGGFLAAMRMKGETVDEIASFANVMREKATRIDAGAGDVLDTCGTGGDGARTFNISTVAAFVAAGAGITVAKHGNRSVSSACGSADVLTALGARIDIPPERVSECVRTVGVGFLFAPLLHASMKFAIGPRRELGIRTFFNILGPLTNPAGAKRQLLGVYGEALVPILAGVLADLGSERAFVVHGCDGLDEVTTTAETVVAEVIGGAVKEYRVRPEDFGLRRSRPEDLIGGDAALNAVVFRSVLEGEKGPKRDIVILNAAFAVCAGGKADTPADGMALAERSIDSGEAMSKFIAYREFSQS